MVLLEQGRKLRRAGQSMRHLLWAPALGLRGPPAQVTTHLLGFAVIAGSAEEGVVDARHQVPVIRACM